MAPAKPWMSPLPLRIFGLFCLAIVAWSVLMPRQTAPPTPAGAAPPPKVCPDYPRGFQGATLAIEFVRTPAEVERITSLSQRRVERELQMDRSVIALYWGLLTILGLLFWRSGLPDSRGLGLASIACATAGAVADMIENRGIGLLLAGSREQEVIDGVRLASYWKWSLLAAAFALLFVFLIRRGVWAWLPAFLFLLAAGSVAYSLLLPGQLPRLDKTVSAMTCSLLATVLLFVIHPRSLLTRSDLGARR